jgi:hypothetical protein
MMSLYGGSVEVIFGLRRKATVVYSTYLQFGGSDKTILDLSLTICF